MGDPAPVTIQVPREAIENLCTDSVRNLIASFVPALLERNRNRVQIEILGCDGDSRELFDIPDVRAWFQKLIEEMPEIFFWIDISSYMFLFLGLMLFTPLRHKGLVGLSPEDVQAYLVKMFPGLNAFCAKYDLSPEPTNQLVKNALIELNEGKLKGNEQ